MFIFFGWGRQTKKKHGGLLPQACQLCHVSANLYLMSYTNWFTFFFIPIIPYSTKDYLACPICGYGFLLTREEAQEAKRLLPRLAALPLDQVAQCRALLEGTNLKRFLHKPTPAKQEKQEDSPGVT